MKNRLVVIIALLFTFPFLESDLLAQKKKGFWDILGDVAEKELKKRTDAVKAEYERAIRESENLALVRRVDYDVKPSAIVYSRDGRIFQVRNLKVKLDNDAANMLAAAIYKGRNTRLDKLYPLPFSLLEEIYVYDRIDKTKRADMGIYRATATLRVPFLSGRFDIFSSILKSSIDQYTNQVELAVILPSLQGTSLSNNDWSLLPTHTKIRRIRFIHDEN